MKRLLKKTLTFIVCSLFFVPAVLLAATAADDLMGLGMSPQLAEYISTKLATVNSSGNLVLPVASGKKLSVTVAGTEEFLVDGSNVTIATNALNVSAATTTVTGGDVILPTAAKGIVAGEATRAANVTTATTLAVPVYISGAAAGTDLTAYVGTGASATGPAVDHFKTRATTGAATTIVQSGDSLGILKFFGANGTTYDPAAYILATVDATPGAATDMPGALDFQLSPDGSVTPASALKLTNDKKATFGGSIKLAATSGKIIPGATSLLVRDAADANTNVTITDAGALTGRTTLTGTTGVSILTSGDFAGSTSGSTLSLQEATAGAACSGTVTANAATPVATSTTCWTTGSRVFLTKTSTSTVNGSCYISATSNGVSFTITCLATDTGTYNWFIIHEAP